jgi:hypothetical protein
MSERPIFPPPDFNVNGRNCWKRSTIKEYKRQLLSHMRGSEVAPEPPSPDDEELLTTTQVAKLFGVHTRSVARWHLVPHPAPERHPGAAAAKLKLAKLKRKSGRGSVEFRPHKSAAEVA